jgi:hypothetical protein
MGRGEKIHSVSSGRFRIGILGVPNSYVRSGIITTRECLHLQHKSGPQSIAFRAADVAGEFDRAVCFLILRNNGYSSTIGADSRA